MRYIFDSSIAETMKSVEVRDLKPGMVLAFTNLEVVTTPVSLVKTQKGKLEFVAKNKRGELISKSWNRHTLVNILDS